MFLSKDKLFTAAELFTVMLSLNLIAKVISCVILEAKKTLTFMMNNLVLINNVINILIKNGNQPAPVLV
ncbi:hypothetical protein F7Q90_24660 [Pantoea stewartii subsp. stewartii]|nr:hypothetical protein F7Q90_24660 [Pantoea stewartii subsp. stewartii]